MTTIYLLRHGQASFGSHNYDQLSELGQRQSQILGGHLQGLGLRFDAIFSGSLARQQDTARHACAQLAGELPALETDPAFNEYDADGLFRAYLPRVLREDPALAAAYQKLSQDRRLFQQAFIGVTRLWVEGATPEHGELEPWKTFEARVQDGLRRLNAAHGKDAQVAVFTSGGVIAAGTAAALELSPQRTLHLNWGIYNASITELKFRRSGPFLLGFNNITHLRLAADPALITHR
ncbi:MAG: histidine phosphatase family protein [Nevskiales bacterium]